MKYVISLGKKHFALEVPYEFTPDEIQDVATVVSKIIAGHEVEEFAQKRRASNEA